MNSLSRTEFRPMSDRQAQARLERMLKNRRAAEAAREARFHKLRASRPAAPKPEPFGWIDSAVFLTPRFVVAVLILIARWSGVFVMNTIVWLISFTDRGEKVQKVHTHNCVADYRLIDPTATVQEIDCAAVAELIEAADAVWRDTLGCTTDGKGERLRAALANIGSAS